MIVRLTALALMLATPLVAQQSAGLSGHDCGRRVGERCQSRIVTEASFGLRLSGKADQVSTFDGAAALNIAATLGVVRPVARRIGLGAVATLGVWDDLYLAAGARMRLHATPRVAIDLTPGYILARGNSAAGRALLDMSVMYRDAVGVSVQLGSFVQTRYAPGFPADPMFEQVRTRSVFAGLRLGSKPARYGLVADAVAVVATALLFVIVCNNQGCD